MKKYTQTGDKWVGRTVKYLTNSGLILIFLLGAVAGSAQSDRRIARWFTEARQLFAQQNYEQAIKNCEKILERDSGFVDARLLLADIFNETQNIPAEIFHLKIAMQQNEAPPLGSLRLGNALFSVGNYNEALPWFQKYLNEGAFGTERMAEVNRKIESCIFAEKAMQKPVRFSPQRMSDAINSVYDEYWPSLSIDQKQLVFTRLVKKPGYRPQEDFYFSEFIEKEWQQAVPISAINTGENEGAQSLSADGKILFFTACNRPGGFGSCDIYYSLYLNGRWSEPYNAGQPLNTAGWEAQPSVSSDGRYLYFSSNRPGGLGEKDIWRAEFLGWDDSGRLKWKKPVNLGKPVNTSGNETSPFIHAGNSHFYFASDSHVGMGKFDLYRVKIEADTVYSDLRNLGYPLNTHNDEQGLHISADGLTGFFSSARDTVSGLDIYSFELDSTLRPQPATYVNALVFDAETKTPVQAEVELLNISAEGESPRYETTGANGELLACLPTGKDYLFSVSKAGYLFYSRLFDLREPRQVYDPYNLEIGLMPVKAGAEMNLHHIYFETDSFRILPESEPELTQLVKFLKDNWRLKVEIQGHTDDTGASEKNQVLSEKRARAVVDFLVKRGVEEERLNWAGYGENRPVAGNDTREGRRLNRRTTIKILGE
jgi:outer membrane protein OmpA-like peptidoglycan-associated protein/tetratricopeptide (TPR) repeat protein